MVDDEDLRRIFTESRTIAVVGCSRDAAKEAHRVPRYLQMVGYRILPVNPTADEILGERTYPTLDAVPVPCEVVQIFRPSPDVPPVVEAALRGPARTIWMQLGIRHAEAAARAEAAGRTVVQNRCMMREHARLFGREIPE